MMATPALSLQKHPPVISNKRAGWPVLRVFAREHLVAAWLTLLVLGLLLLVLPYPISGSDGGNWLALSGGLMGIDANAASTVYPPGFLILLVLIRAFLPPVEALRLAGSLVALLPGVGCYLLLRGLGLRLMAVAGVCFALAGYSAEMLAWGGYPQLLGTGLVTFACTTMLYAYRTGRYQYFAATGALAGLATMTHQLAGLQAVVAIAAASGVILLIRPREWANMLRQWAVIIGVFGMIVLPGVPIYIDLATRAGTSAFNANGFTLADLTAFITYDAPVVWALVGACVPLAIVIRASRRAGTDVAVLIGLAFASLGVTLVTLEVRALYLGLLLGVVSTAVLFSDLIRTSGRRWGVVLAASACAVWLTLLSAGIQRLDHTTRYYTMLDSSLLDGLTWLQQHKRSGDLAASMRSREKWPLGWWVQGLGQVPTYTEYESRWLYFREEKVQADIAASILANTDPQQAAVEAQRNGVTLLIFDVRDSGEADRWLDSGRVYAPIGLVYSNPSLAIFRVDRPGT